jgi:hypothetical protein
MIWDFCPDMMHIIKTFFERLVLGVFSGERKPKFTSKPPTKPSPGAPRDVRQEYERKQSKYRERVREYEEAIAAFNECQFSEAEQKLVDLRVQNLVGYAYWIRSSLVSSHEYTNNTHNILEVLHSV